MPRVVDLHPNARKHFDEQGGVLFRSIVRLATLPEPATTFRPDVFSSSRVTRENIEGDVHISHRDPETGKVLTKLFSDRGHWVGLLADGVQALKKVASGLQRLPPIEPVASEEFVEEQAFLWLKASFRAQTSESLVSYVARAIETAAKEFTVIIPLSDMFLESDLTLGEVTLKTFPTFLFEQMERSGNAYAGDEFQAHAGHCRELRETYQGHAVAQTTVYAEQNRAKQVALNRVQAAVGVLRVFAPSHIDPDLVSYWAPWGHHSRPKQFVLFCEPADRLMSTTDEILGQVAQPALDTRTVALMNEMGLESFRTILAKVQRTEFEEDLLSATIEFGQGALVPELHLRLVVYCVALERMLLRDSSEPIIQNLADRLALFIRDGLEERKAVLRTVRDAYAIRSGYVHHGTRSDDKATIAMFSRLGVQFFLKLAKQVDRFATRSQFIEYVDGLKMAAPAT